jgi:hypothetical protein
MEHWRNEKRQKKPEWPGKNLATAMSITNLSGTTLRWNVGSPWWESSNCLPKEWHVSMKWSVLCLLTRGSEMQLHKGDKYNTCGDHKQYVSVVWWTATLFHSLFTFSKYDMNGQFHTLAAANLRQTMVPRNSLSKAKPYLNCLHWVTSTVQCYTSMQVLGDGEKNTEC